MALFRRLDAWLGLHVFHPPIIAICQLIGTTQYRVSRDTWFVTVMIAMWLVKDKSWISIAIMGVVAVFFTIRAMFIRSDVPEASPFWFRLMLWFFFVTSVADFFIRGWNGYVLRDIFPLFAEYALTITTIPPRKKKEPKRKVAAA